MALYTSDPHLLEFEGYDDGFPVWTLFHNEDCPYEVWGMGDGEQSFDLHHFICHVEAEFDSGGFDALFKDTELEPGRYWIQAWSSGPDYVGEWDGGVEILGREGEYEPPTPVSPSEG